MSNATDQLVAVRSAFASVNKGSEVNEESWMTCRSFVCPPISLTQRYSQWCTTNWGELLQPGPLSLSLLDSILIVASSTNDFNLDRNGAPPFIWKFAQHPDSFQRGLQQMANEGFNAFGTAHTNMESIRNLSGQMSGPNRVIKTLVDLIRIGTVQDIQDHFQTSITDLNLSQTCRDRAQNSADAFHNIMDWLSLMNFDREMVLACTYAVHIQVLELQRSNKQTMVNEANANADMMKNSYMKAEEEFNDAVDDVPSGWDLVGMQVVESLILVTRGPECQDEVDQTRSQLEATRDSFQKVHQCQKRVREHPGRVADTRSAEYVVPVKIGTPGVTLNLDFDTGSNPKPNPNARRTFRVSAPTHLHGKPPPKAPKPLVFCANGMALSQGLFRRTANPLRSPVKTSNATRRRMSRARSIRPNSITVDIRRRNLCPHNDLSRPANEDS
ncbi:hypothetical protein B0H14DRAFT_2635573 [Mycena olivaceomarginata]|nr:hypothetical protein B0H14DRAFT_2635573 [Mycena olivaceomarginata]